MTAGPRALHITTSGRGPGVCFLHPIGLSGAFWHETIGELSDAFSCYSVDLRGHGASPWEGAPFALRDLARDVLESLPGEPMLVVGCSMGGMVAQELALLAPARARGLVLSNSTGRVPPAARPALEARAQASLADPASSAEQAVSRWFAPDFVRTEPQRTAAIETRLLDTDPHVIACGWRAIADFDVETRLADLPSPALVVTGTADSSTSPAAARAHAALFSRGESQFVEGAGHLTPYERPRMFASLIRRFVAELQDEQR